MGDRQKSITVKIWGGFAAIAVAAFFAIHGTASAAAGINPQLSFEGKIVSSSGQNIADGTYNMEFKIYQDGNSSGSGSTLKWTEDRLVGGTGGVTFTSGTFQVNLGSVTAFGGSVDWNQDTLWLSMQIGNTSSCTISTNFHTDCSGDGEMTPFIRLTSTPYAMNADKLDGIDSSGFVQLTPSGQQSGNINVSGTITSGAVNGINIASTIQPSSAGGLTVTANGSNALTLTGGAASTWSTSSGALTLTSAAAATWSTSAGLLTVQGGGGVAVASANGTTSSNVSLKSGDASSGVSGNVTIDNGTYTSGTPTIVIGNSTQAHTISIGNGGTNAQSVTIGSTSSSSATTINGGTSGTAIALTTGNGGAIALTSSAGSGAISATTGAANINLTSNGSSNGTVVKSSTNSTSAFQVQNSGSTSIFNVDTTNNILTTNAQIIGAAANVGSEGHIFSDGFESNGSDAWTAGTGGTGTASVQTTTVRNGKYALSLDNTAGSKTTYEQTSFAAQSTVFGRVYFNVPTANLGNPTYLMDFGTAAIGSGNHIDIELGTSGNVCWDIRRGSFGTMTSATQTCSATAPSTNAWHKLETQFTINNAGAGILKVWVDGTLTSINSTTLSNGTNNITTFALGNDATSTSTKAFFDDAVLDTVATGDSASLNVSDSLHVAGSTSFSSSALFSSVTNAANALQVQNSSGTNLFSVDTSGNNVVIGSSSANANAILLVVNNYNQAADPTGTNGAIYYNTTTNVFRCFQGSAWTNCVSGPASYSILTSTSANSTYTVPSGVSTIIVEMVGAGAGGGGAAAANSQYAAAGGGGAGGYARKVIVNPASSYKYTILAGGNGGTAGANNGSTPTATCFGTNATACTTPIVSCNGGNGGTGAANGTTVVTVAGGTGGTCTGGDINITGASGTRGSRASGTLGISGSGATTMFGSGGGGCIGLQAGEAAAATAYGTGGGGACTQSNTNEAGGNGAQGVIIVWEFK
ncbi:MAG TPA: hypothetical protein VLG47_03790 [Candidatus Saccharimonadales bacterium]|nr:hypothetical protein [Candidatus Saccharimonadales bacterium]